MEKSSNSRVILGEASESDSEDDSIPANCSTHVVLEPTPIQLPPIVVEEPNKTSIRKEITSDHIDVIRNNIAFRNKICSLTDKIVGQIRRELSATSDQLLSSEMTLSETSRSLNTLRHNAKQIDAKLNTIVTSNFFPEKLNMLDYFRDIKITEEI